jgi:tetratricopeptide (TPR) repeat protein
MAQATQAFKRLKFGVFEADFRTGELHQAWQARQVARAAISIADVAVVYDEPAQQTDAGALEGAPSGALVLKFFGFAAALILTIYLSWSFYPWRQSLPPIHSLAVLPLKNLSGDASQDYFADGMTDELIAYLGQIRALRVISRTSAMTYKNGHKPPAEIARELNVEAVVEGSVVMGQTSEAILELKKAKSLDTLSLIISADPVDILCVAHQFDESVQEGKRALEIDPSFAVARYVLGQAYEQKHMQDEAIAEIRRAIEISGHSSVFDSGLAHAYAISGRQQEATTIAKGFGIPERSKSLSRGQHRLDLCRARRPGPGHDLAEQGL